MLLIFMRHPQTSTPILERWMVPTDAQLDLESLESQGNQGDDFTGESTQYGFTRAEKRYGSQLNYFLDLLVRFTTSIFRDQGKYVKTYAVLIDRLQQLVDSWSPAHHTALSRIEKDLICRLNVLIFEAMKDIKTKVLGLAVAPFIRALVLCSIKIVEKSDLRDRKVYVSLVKNGFYEIIQLFQKPKLLQNGSQDAEEMQNTIISILGFFKRNTP